MLDLVLEDQPGEDANWLKLSAKVAHLHFQSMWREANPDGRKEDCAQAFLLCAKDYRASFRRFLRKLERQGITLTESVGQAD